VVVIGVVFAAYAALAHDSMTTRLFVAVGALVCLIIGVGGIRQARGRESIPIFSISDDGIEHALVGLIRWDEIDDVRIYSFGGNRSLGIWPHDPALVAKRSGRWWAIGFAKLNAVFGAAPLSFPESVLPVDETFAAIEQRRGSHRER
jgi:hypothetical protein